MVLKMLFNGVCVFVEMLYETYVATSFRNTNESFC